MAYLPSDAVHNLILKNPTSLEIDFIIYLAQYLDTDDKIRGVYYKDAMEALGCCKQSFYNVLRSLEKKSIIRIDRESEIDYDITFLFGDDFSYEHAKKVGYLPARLDTIHSKQFKELPAIAKMIALDLLLIVRTNKGWKIGVQTFYDKYAPEDFSKSEGEFVLPFPIKVKTLKGYLKQLKSIFYINKTLNGLYTFAVRTIKVAPDDVRKKDVKVSDNDLWTQRLVSNLCRRHKIIGYAKQKLKDTAHLLLQYKNIAKELGKSVCDVMISAFDEAVLSSGRRLNPKYIHVLMEEFLYDT